MKRKKIAGAIACILAFSLSGCGLGAEPGNITNSEKETTSTLYSEQILTKEQMLSDYDDMWKAIKESYPFFGVLARSHPEKPNYYDTIIETYRSHIENMELEGHPAMFEFIDSIANSLYEVCGATGHVSIINPNYFRGLDVYKRYLDEMPEVQPWVDVIERPEVIDFYQYYDYLLKTLLEVKEENISDSEEADQVQNEMITTENLTMEKLSDTEKIAYVKVNSFEDTFMEDDLPKIRTFLEEVKDYDHLIIDIQENGGGNTVYWEDAFVRPNISDSVTYQLIRLMKDTPLNQQFYGSFYKNSQISGEIVANHPKFTKLPKEDTKDLTLARDLSTTLEPEFEEKLFQGKIWVLIGPSVYSSSEAFAVFCKETGFATLVGQTTGGSDSGGAILYELPISHLLVQFDVEYCLNADGSCNMEVGTIPDIESDDALKTVLELIPK